MRKLQFEYNGKSITLSEANTAMSIRREMLRSNAVYEGTVEQRIAGQMFYPDIMACVVAYDGYDNWPPPVEEFVNEWPARFTDKLREGCYELNPQWWPNYDEADVKKKELT